VCCHRRLNIPGEEELIGTNVHFCATCDGAFCKGKKVLVLGWLANDSRPHEFGVSKENTQASNDTKRVSSTQVLKDAFRISKHSWSSAICLARSGWIEEPFMADLSHLV
jgi:hypothetical protein